MTKQIISTDVNYRLMWKSWMRIWRWSSLIMKQLATKNRWSWRELWSQLQPTWGVLWHHWTKCFS